MSFTDLEVETSRDHKLYRDLTHHIAGSGRTLRGSEEEEKTPWNEEPVYEVVVKLRQEVDVLDLSHLPILKERTKVVLGEHHEEFWRTFATAL